MVSKAFRWLYIALAASLMLVVGAFFSFAYLAMHFAASGAIVAAAVLVAVAQFVSVEGFGRPLIPWIHRPPAFEWPLAVKFVLLAVAYGCVASWTYMGVCLPAQYGDDKRLPPVVRGACHDASRWIAASRKDLVDRFGWRTPI